MWPLLLRTFARFVIGGATRTAAKEAAEYLIDNGAKLLVRKALNKWLKTTPDVVQVVKACEQSAVAQKTSVNAQLVIVVRTFLEREGIDDDFVSDLAFKHRPTVDDLLGDTVASSRSRVTSTEDARAILAANALKGNTV